MPVLPPTFTLSAERRTSPLTTLTNAAAQLLRRLPPSLRPRQSVQPGGTYPIPAQYAGINTAMSPGAVAGIVLGSVAGFLLLLLLLWFLSNGTTFIRSTAYVEEDVVVRTTPARSRRSRRTPPEMAAAAPPRERIIRTERIVREDSRPPPIRREPSRMRETILVEEDVMSRDERRVEGDDVIEVMEEHSSLDLPPPRRKSGRRGSYRE